MLGLRFVFVLIFFLSGISLLAVRILCLDFVNIVLQIEGLDRERVGWDFKQMGLRMSRVHNYSRIPTLINEETPSNR